MAVAGRRRDEIAGWRMISLADILVEPESSIREALHRINEARTQMVLVADTERRLLGTVSDGDIRRALLAGLSLDDAVKRCMHPTPTVASPGLSRSQLIELCRDHGFHQVPIVDETHRILDLKTIDELLAPPARDNAVVLMVGGRGERLGELTRHTPKPMLQVGGRPLLEHIIHNYVDQGFRRFWLAVNYRAEVIEDHFADGSNFGCQIEYVRETKPMGTAGALSLLPHSIGDLPFIVSNGDLLTRVDMGAVVDHHAVVGADATMAVREYEVQVPYGVVHADGDRMTAILEKPVHRHLIAGGLYVISPTVLNLVPEDSFVDMPTLLDRVAAQGYVSVFAMDGYWLDIGRQADYQRACDEFLGVHPTKVLS
jgi:dTDP-glucose pyrophosphorylase/predicted transcriptional regulator